MAEAKKIESILDNLAECAICLSDVTNHRVLPCQHLFCQACLEPIVKDDNILCPVCRTICPLLGQTVDTLPRSLVLMNLIDKLCGVCKQKSRDIHCPHCGKWTCHPCHQNCRVEVEHKLKSFRDETDELMAKRQRHMNLLCEEMSRTNKEIFEMSESIDSNIDLVIEALFDVIKKIKTKQNILKKDLQVKRTDVLEILQSSYSRSVDESTKLAEFTERYKIGKNDTEKFDVLSNLCKQWENYLGTSRNAALSTPAAPQFSINDIKVEHESDCGGIQVRISVPCVKSQPRLINLHEEASSHLSYADTTEVYANSDMSGAQELCRSEDASKTASRDRPHPSEDTDTTVTSEAQGDQHSQFPRVAEYLVSPVQSATVLRPQHPQQSHQDYTALSIPCAVHGSKGSGESNFNFPSFVAVSPVSGNIFVTDVNNHRIQVLTEQGRFLRHFGPKGRNVGQFKFQSNTYNGGISVTEDGYIVVADTGNNRVQMFDEQGLFIKVFGSRGRRQGQLQIPLGVTVGPTGDIYVCDYGNYRIQVFDGNGRVIRVFGSKNRMGGWNPYDITVTNNGTVIVAYCGGTDNGKLEIFSRNGQHVNTIRCAGNNQLQSPLGVTVDANDNIIVTDNNAEKVHILRQNGELIKTFGVRGQAPGQFGGPGGVACTRDGRIIVVDVGNNRIQLF